MTSTPFLKSSLWFAIALSLVVEAGPARGDAPPEVYVPHSRVAVDLDGKLSAAEWDDAATVADLRLTATQQPLQPGTRFYLKWNQGNLLVGVRCFETAPNYPKASRRNPTDLLTDDDAVQVILGTADQLALSPEVLKVGGYPGAMDEPPPRPDHYYAFSVNSAGSVSRTYNEGPLRRPLFKAAASQAAGAWTVEMRIPFASAGIDHPTGGPIYANLFRFRPPDMAAWYSRSFGGYVPMPFAKLHVLPRGQHSQRTIEPPPETTHQPPAESPWSAKLHWYPLASRVAAEVTGPSHSEGATARLSAEGVPATEARLSADGQTRLILVVPPAAKLPAEAKLVIKAPDGTLLHSESCSLPPVDRPSWLGTQVAKEYLTERVPKPWTRPQVTDSAVQLKHSRLAFGTHGLVESVSGKWGELLAGEGQIVLETATGKVALEPVSREVLPGATSVQIDSELRFDGGTVEVRATVDYDGFTIYKLRVRDLPPQAIEHLAVQVPLRKAHARFVHQFHVQGTRGLTGAGWEGKAGPVWVGGQEAGLAFNYDIDPFLSADRRTQIEVLEQNKQTWLRVNLVDAPGQVMEKDHVFRFFLLPTPTKEPSLKKDGFFHASMEGWFENWSDYQGYPDLAKLPQARERAEAAHAKDLPFLMYFNMMLAENSPGFAEHRSELIIPPGQMWYKREYNPGKGVPCWVCCTRGPYGDLLLEGMSRLATEADLDGVYMDGTSLAWDCHNPAHAPCAETDLSWDEESLTPLVATRNFLKRLRGIFDAKGKPMLVAHNGGGLQIETLSLCDVFYEGEQLSDVRYRRGYRPPLHVAAVCYSGRPWGFRTDVLANMIRPRHMMTYAALHDAEVSGADDLAAVIYGDFQDEATSYHPYWRPQRHVRLEQGEVLFSYYLRPEAAMLVVSNLTWDNQQVVLNTRKLFPKHLQTSAVNVETGQPVAIDQGHLSVEIPRHRFVALRIEPGAATAPPTGAKTPLRTPAEAVSIDRYVPEQWKLNTDTPGVTVEHRFDLGKGRFGPKLQSTVHHDVAEARLKNNALGSTLTVRLLIAPSGRLGVRLGATKFVFDGGRVTIDGVDPWNEGQVLRPQLRQSAEELILTVDRGVLNAAYAGEPLAVNVSVEPPTEERGLALWTWAGDSLAFDVLEISNRRTDLYDQAGKHPVR